MAYLNFSAIFEFLRQFAHEIIDAYIIFHSTFDNFEIAHKTYFKLGV